MQSTVRITSWVLLFVALGAAAASWATPRFDLDAADAADVAHDSLAVVGIRSFVTEDPTTMVHVAEDGTEVDAWSVVAEVALPEARGTDLIELRVQRDAGQLVYVDDRIGADDTERLLTDEQFDQMGMFRDTSVRGRWIRRNGVASVTGALVAGCSFLLARRSDPLWSTP